MSLIYDEYGRPFIIVREQQAKARLRGIEAQKANILAARAVSSALRTSLGPKGMDKMMVSQDGEVTITNDGATILKEMHVEHQVARLMVDLSQSQDHEIGDGTTGVVVIAGALLEQAEKLLDRGLHPMRIAEGFDRACEICVNYLKTLSSEVRFDSTNLEPLIEVAMTTLSSKLVSANKRRLSEICVEALMSVADLERGEVNLDLIRLECKPGGRSEDTNLFQGLVIDKDWSHPQMAGHMTGDINMVLLTCPFEPPKPKTKHKIDVTSCEDYAKLSRLEGGYFNQMINKLKQHNINLVLCQWGFDDEANYLLYSNHIHAVRWVGGVEMEAISIASQAPLVARFDDISDASIARCVVSAGKLDASNKSLVLTTTRHGKSSVSIIIKGSSNQACQEIKRCLHDVLCILKTLIHLPRLVYGGGCCDIACAIHLMNSIKENSLERFAMEAFAVALEDLPMALAENSGLDGIAGLSQIKARQVNENNPYLGVDCMQSGDNDMRNQYVVETLKGKVSQMQLATQVVKMILKIDDVIITNT